MLRKIALLLIVLALVALLAPAVIAQGDTFSLTIMHTNDVHGAYGPYSASADATTDGGAAREMTVINQIRGEGGDSILLDGGDRFTGTLFHQQWRGQEADRIMNAMHYDAMTVGNHEFDDGQQALADFVSGANFPVITANVDFSGAALLKDKIKPYTILTVAGQQIGVIGLTPPDTAILSSPGAGVTFSDDIEGIVQPIIDSLTAQGVNKIILLTHIGLLADKALASELTGVDIIVGGHSHTLLSNTYSGAEGVYPVVVNNPDGKPVYIVQAGSSLKYMGRLNVTFDANGVVTRAAGDTILLSRYIPGSADIQTIVDDLRAPISTLVATPVGTSSVFLVGDRTVCRVQECNLGDLITDAVREYSHAQIVFENGGGIRSNVPIDGAIPADLTLPEPSPINLGDVLTVLPFGNVVATFELKGSDVVAALENGVSQVEAVAGRFPQVSGLRYTWDGTKAPGSRIVSVEVMDDSGSYAPIDPNATYTVAANDFMRRGGDGYSVFADNAINPYDGGSPLDVVVENYIQAHSPIAPMVEGRITRVDSGS